MRETTRVMRETTRAMLVLAASAALAVVPALPASAHNHVIAMSPAEGAVVTEQPGTISLETNDELLDVGGSTLLVQGPDGAYYGDGCTEVAGATAATEVQLGEPGEYTVTWQVVSTDGHPISGSWAFDWQPAAGVVLAEGTAEAGSCGGDSVVSAPSEQEQEPTDAAAASVPVDALWIGGGVLAVAVAALATWLLVRRRT
ncbi:copper resistance protein CopC [Agromyces sp. NPDC058484]|uniref:copper resistance CopC family protein n=1 Tax=Agromyces sp. NPDC058484 TaxID=3346524 RepID=UPI00365F6575